MRLARSAHHPFIRFDPLLLHGLRRGLISRMTRQTMIGPAAQMMSGPPRVAQANDIRMAARIGVPLIGRR